MTYREAPAERLAHCVRLPRAVLSSTTMWGRGAQRGPCGRAGWVWGSGVCGEDVGTQAAPSLSGGREPACPEQQRAPSFSPAVLTSALQKRALASFSDLETASQWRAGRPPEIHS